MPEVTKMLRIEHDFDSWDLTYEEARSIRDQLDQALGEPSVGKAAEIVIPQGSPEPDRFLRLMDKEGDILEYGDSGWFWSSIGGEDYVYSKFNQYNWNVVSSETDFRVIP